MTKTNDDDEGDVCLMETNICREISEEQESFGEVRSSRPRGIHLLWFLHLQNGLNCLFLTSKKFSLNNLGQVVKPEKFLVEGVGKGSIPGCMDFSLIDQVILPDHVEVSHQALVES